MDEQLERIHTFLLQNYQSSRKHEFYVVDKELLQMYITDNTENRGIIEELSGSKTVGTILTRKQGTVYDISMFCVHLDHRSTDIAKRLIQRCVSNLSNLQVCFVTFGSTQIPRSFPAESCRSVRLDNFAVRSRVSSPGDGAQAQSAQAQSAQARVLPLPMNVLNQRILDGLSNPEKSLVTDLVTVSMLKYVSSCGEMFVIDGVWVCGVYETFQPGPDRTFRILWVVDTDAVESGTRDQRVAEAIAQVSCAVFVDCFISVQNIITLSTIIRLNQDQRVRVYFQPHTDLNIITADALSFGDKDLSPSNVVYLNL